MGMDVRQIGPGNGGSGTLQIIPTMGVTTAYNYNETDLPVLFNQSYTQNTETISLVSGPNTINIPTTAGGFVLIMPSSISNVNTGPAPSPSIAFGTTPFPLNPNGINILSFANPPPSVMTLTAGGAISGVVLIWI